MPGKTIYQRKAGDIVKPKREIPARVIKQWTYMKDYNGGGMTPAAELTIAEINTRTAGRFFLVLNTASSPPTPIKVSAEEFALNFD